MSSHNWYSLFFVGLLLVLLVIGRLREKPAEPILQEEIERTSVMAADLPVFAGAAADKPFLADLSLSVFVPPPAVNAGVVLVKDLARGEVLLSQNSEGRWALASLTKLMTAVVAAENIGLNKTLRFNEKAIAAEGIGGGFSVGETASVGDLIGALLTVSSNDAAAALADFYGYENFMAAMRRKAVELGMTRTSLADPSGLSPLNQSTADDIEKLVRYILNTHPDFFEISRQAEILINGRRLLNIHPFAGRSDFLGGKTGFTEEAGGNLISLFNYQSHPVLVLVMGAEDRLAETEKIRQWLNTKQ